MPAGLTRPLARPMQRRRAGAGGACGRGMRGGAAAAAVLLDGYAVTAAALAAVGSTLRSASPVAGHRSAEPGHDLLLAELGLEPLLDLRLRSGEASGALLALPLIEAAGALHEGMGTFEESGVARSR